MRVSFSLIAVGVLVAGAVLLAPLSGTAPAPPTPLTPVPRAPAPAPPTPLTPLPSVRAATPKAPFYFSSLWVTNAVTGYPAPAPALDGKAWWPLVYYDLDLRPAWIHLTWVPLAFPEGKIADIVASKSYALRLVLNGRVLHRGPSGEYSIYAVPPGASSQLYGCPSGKMCLVTKVPGTTWFSMSAPWHLELQVPSPDSLRDPIYTPCPGDPGRLCPSTLGSPEPMKVSATVARSAPKGSFFAAKIYPTFQHPRCTTCHSFGSPWALRDHHTPYVGQTIDVKSVATPRGTLLTCNSGCHYPKMGDERIWAILKYLPGGQFSDVDWKTPGFDMGIIWTGKSASEICKIVTTKLPTAHALRHHFHNDARVAWAVQSGKLPPQTGGYKSLAPPGSYLEWVKLTAAWADGGFPCPK
ncbi:MAG: hypothetical protein ACREJ6_02570 [Candidatus Methylomirabilis sp.]